MADEETNTPAPEAAAAPVAPATPAAPAAPAAPAPQAEEAAPKKDDKKRDIFAEIAGAEETQIKVHKAKGSKNISRGIVHVTATFNNTIVSVTDSNGNTLGNYGTGGVIRELTPDGQTAFGVRFDVPEGNDFYNKMVGHNVLLEDLYALNGGPR